MPMHRLQIHLIVHNQRAPTTIPPSYIWVCAVALECVKEQTKDTHNTGTQTAMSNIHFASAMLHARCNYAQFNHATVHSLMQ